MLFEDLQEEDFSTTLIKKEQIEWFDRENFAWAYFPSIRRVSMTEFVKRII